MAPFARAWTARGGDVRVCCLKSIGGNPFEEELRALGVPVTNLGARNLRDLGAFRRLLRLLREQQIGLVHAHLAYASIWGALASRITGIPCVATLHVPPSGAPPRSREGIRESLMVLALNRWAARVIAVSNAARDAWIERGLRASKTVVVGNGIEVEAFAPRSQEPEEHLVTTVSVLREGKGIEVLIDAVPIILESHPRARFLVVGDGPLREPLAVRAEILGDRVTFAGFRRDVAALLAASRVFVLPSLGDAYPTALMEAMAAGLPVVSTRVGGIPEIVDDGRTGRLVPAGDARALARAVSDLLGSPEEREALGRAARAEAERRFSTAAWVERLAEVYGNAPTLTVVEFAGRGGMIHYAYQLCRALASTGADVTLVTSRHYELDALRHPFRLRKILRLWDPKPAGEPGPRKLRRIGRAFLHYREWLRLALHLRKERPDLVLLGDIRFPGDLAPILLLRAMGLRLVDICHNVAPYAAGGFRRSALDRFLYRRIYRCFERIFVHFGENRRAFLADYGLAPERVVAIPHGNEAIFEELRDPAVDEAGLRRELGLEADEPVLLLLGTLSRYKGIDLLLQAFARLPRGRLVLAGFPAADFDLPAHQALARELGIADRVLWVPRYVESEEVAAWMGLASVAVFPYREVFQSGALALAQTFGVPVVASAVGAMPEAVGGSGLLVPPGDPDALAAALLSLLDDPALARRLGERARQDARERFSWERIGLVIVEATR